MSSRERAARPGQGKTAREAVRCLKRQLSDQVYKAMRADAAAAALRDPMQAPRAA